MEKKQPRVSMFLFPIKLGFVMMVCTMVLLARLKSVTALAITRSGNRSRMGFNNRLLDMPSRSSSRAFGITTTLWDMEKTSQGENDSTISDSSIREDALHEALRRIHLDPELFFEANLRNMRDPTAGYDPDIGKPAIRTYRSFVYPKTSETSDVSRKGDGGIRLVAAADRCARQIDFLRRRHRSHETDWVRHTDTTIGSEEDDNVQSTRQKFPLILVLDNVRSAFNVGSIFRTADACGCQEVITTGITAHPRGSGAEKLSKSALGAEKLVSTQHFPTTRDAVNALKEAHPDWTFIGVETTENSKMYSEVDYPRRCVLILGNEVTGIDPELMTELDSIIEIPMFGAKNSLNIAACAPVVLYEILRQWGVSKSDGID